MFHFVPIQWKKSCLFGRPLRKGLGRSYKFLPRILRYNVSLKFRSGIFCSFWFLYVYRRREVYVLLRRPFFRPPCLSVIFSIERNFTFLASVWLWCVSIWCLTFLRSLYCIYVDRPKGADFICMRRSFYPALLVEIFTYSRWKYFTYSRWKYYPIW